jgi:hypothetical protein
MTLVDIKSVNVWRREFTGGNMCGNMCGSRCGSRCVNMCGSRCGMSPCAFFQAVDQQ